MASSVVLDSGLQGSMEHILMDDITEMGEDAGLECDDGLTTIERDGRTVL